MPEKRRPLFRTITGTALDGEPHAGFVDRLAQFLADNDIEAVRADFGAITVLKETIRLMAETGAAIPKWPIA